MRVLAADRYQLLRARLIIRSTGLAHSGHKSSQSCRCKPPSCIRGESPTNRVQCLSSCVKRIDLLNRVVHLEGDLGSVRRQLTAVLVAIAFSISLTGQSAAAAQPGTPLADLGSPASRGGVSQGPGTAQRAKQALRLTEQAHKAISDNNYELALECYTSVSRQYGDLALANYGRIGRALLLYQTGERVESILELQGLASSLRGFAEIHAALAAMLYAETPPAVQRAELQWDVASEFDTRYADSAWVAREKHWPPAVLQALDTFLTLGQG